MVALNGKVRGSPKSLTDCIAALKDMPLAWLKIEREHSPESTKTSMETRYNPGPDQIPGERPLRSKEIQSEVKIK